MSGPSAPATKVVRFAFPRYDGTLTPYTFALGYPLVTLVYDTLMWRDAGGVPRLWLARSLAASDGGRRVTVTLRPGIRWQDGQPLDATDVAFTFRYLARHYQPRFTPELADVASVRATRPLQVVFALRHASLGFADQPLADVPILPRHLWQGLPSGRDAPAGLPVGSGPYRLVAGGPRRGYVFTANDAYFRGRPRVRRLEVSLIGGAQAAYTALGRAQLDMLPLSLPGEAAAELAATPGIRLSSGADYTGTALLLNLRRGPFRRLAVRRALAALLDRRRIAGAVGSPVVAAQGFLDPASPWSSAPAWPALGRPSAAARVLAGVGSIRVLAPRNDPLRLETGRQVVLSLRRAGVAAELAELSGRSMSRAIGEDGSAPNFEAAIESTPPLASYDPDFLARLFGSDSRSAPLNFGGYQSAGFDALAREVAAAPDAAARHRAVSAEQSLLAREVPSIPLFFARGTFAYRPARYAGWVYVKGTGILDKRSFLSAQGAAGVGPPPAGARRGHGSSGGIDLVNVLSLVALAAVLGLAVAALAQRSRERRGNPRH